MGRESDEFSGGPRVVGTIVGGREGEQGLEHSKERFINWSQSIDHPVRVRVHSDVAICVMRHLPAWSKRRGRPRYHP